MKKKLLSLVLAGAMVASTSVSAFAQNKTIQETDTTTPETDISITGNVLDEGGNAAPGTFNVTIPTTASFTVSKENGFASAPITIENNGEQDIEVYAVKFADVTPADGIDITVTNNSDIKQKNRNYVSINLEGNLKTVYLKSEDTTPTDKTGIYKEEGLVNPATNDEDLRLSVIKSKQSDKLKLNGRSGEAGGRIESALSNNFTLTLKIKKSAKPANSPEQ